MQFDVPDPAYTGSARSRARFRLAIRLASGLVVVLALVALIDAALDVDPAWSGIRPRRWSGLIGIVFAPLVHEGFEHLVSNLPPLFVLTAAMVFLYPRSVLRAFPAIWLGTGAVVWAVGRESVHFGASGLVYGMASYILCAGLLRRDRRAVAMALAVWFMYGSLVWGVFPGVPRMSWETHAAAAAIGALLAFVFRHSDVPPRKRYAWEDEADETPAPAQDADGDDRR